MHFLVSNDDGFYADGIKFLRKALEELGQVTVVAPDRERSATGHGITVHRPLRIKEIQFKNSSSVGYAVDGTPADCVKLALEAILPQKPDLLISGINFGPNLGTDVLYSGTVSAAYEGIINGVPAIALSLNSYQDADFNYAAEFIRTFIPLVLQKQLPPNVLLNINIPNTAESKGVKFTRLGKRRYIDVFHKRTDPHGKYYFWMAGEPENLDESDPETDVYAVKNNYISVTPIKLDVTDYQFMTDIKKWL